MQKREFDISRGVREREAQRQSRTHSVHSLFSQAKQQWSSRRGISSSFPLSSSLPSPPLPLLPHLVLCVAFGFALTEHVCPFLSPALVLSRFPK